MILLASAILLFIFNYNKKILDKSQTKVFRISNLYVLIFLFWSITTSPSIMNIQLFSINLHDYLYGALSIFAATGRFAWPVIYFILFFSLLYIYKNSKRIYSYSWIVIILLLQSIDVSTGIKNNSFNRISENIVDPFWTSLSKNFLSIRTTYLFNNYGPIFPEFSKILGNLDNIKTDIILNASLDRQKAADVRYKLIENITQKKIDKQVAYIIDNEGHLLQLKKTFEDNNVGFFFKDNFWVMLQKKNQK